MDNNDNNDRFWSLVADYGIGVLTVQTDGLRSRPVMPVINRSLGEIVCIVDNSWIGHNAFGELPTALTFLNEHTFKSLTLRGIGRASPHEPDISAAWNGLCNRSYPDGPETPGLLAMRIVPQSADQWQLGHPKPTSHWQLEGGSFMRRPDAH